LFLCEYIIMPNHLHTIVEIRNPDINESQGASVQSQGIFVQSHGRAILQSQSQSQSQTDSQNDLPIKRNMPIRLPKSISSFMAGFKSAVNTQIDNYIDEHHLNIPKYNKNNHFFQHNYYDQFIRKHSEYKSIAKTSIINSNTKE